MATSLYCPHCRKHTALRVAPAAYKGDYGAIHYTSAIWEADHRNSWWIGICNACQQPSLVLNDGAIVHPTPAPSPTDENIPTELASDLDEAKLCLQAKCFRACAVIARRCIQRACIARGATKGDLVSQIKELTNSGVITKDIEEWATVVRFVGNDAAHPNQKEVIEADAIDTLKLAEEFLHVLFVTTAIAKARRAERKSRP